MRSQVEQWGDVDATPPDSRAEAAALFCDVLTDACTTGVVRLIGSMAEPGGDDAFSDIDVSWNIPAEQADAQLESLRTTLHQVGTVESLRVDPEPRLDWRLVFVRFEGWPLWWRVDLEIHSAGIGSRGVPDADDWSPYESACMGVVVTLKALARRRPDEAEALWARALQRVEAVDVAGEWAPRIDALLEQLATSSPDTADLVTRTRRLSREVLGG